MARCEKRLGCGWGVCQGLIYCNINKFDLFVLWEIKWSYSAKAINNYSVYLLIKSVDIPFDLIRPADLVKTDREAVE